MVHIGIVPVCIMLSKRGVFQHKAPHSGQVVSFHPFFPSGTFLFSGIQAYPPLSLFFLGHIFRFLISIFLLLSVQFRCSIQHLLLFFIFKIPPIRFKHFVSFQERIPFVFIKNQIVIIRLITVFH